MNASGAHYLGKMKKTADDLVEGFEVCVYG